MGIFVSVPGTLNVGPGKDTNFSNVVLLLHGNGTNGSTSIIDSSTGTHSTVCTGSNAISTAQYKFGTSSLKGVGPTGNYFAVTLGTTDGSLGTDFTIETFVRDGGNNVVFYAGDSVPTNAWYLYNDLFQWIVSGTATTIAMTTNFGTGTWHHLAVSRTAGLIRCFVDGTQSGSGTYTGTINASTIDFGRYRPNNSICWPGYYDDIRITKGVGRYTANFTPPIRQLPDS